MRARLSLILILFLTACSGAAPAVGAVASAPTATAPAASVATASTATATSPALASTPIPAAVDTPAPAVAPPQPSPAPLPARTPAGALARIPAWQPVTLTQLNMLDVANGWAMEREGHILRTLDGGITWQDVSPPEQGFQLAAVLDPQTAWAVSSGSAVYTEDGQGGRAALGQDSALTWRTLDGGRTWQMGQPFSVARLRAGAAYGLPNTFSAALQMFDAQEGWLFLTVDCEARATCGWQLYRTTDGGDSWKRTSDSEGSASAPPLQSVYFTDQRSGWGAGSFPGISDALNEWSATLYQTTDAGQTWQPIALDEPAELPRGFTSAVKACGTRRVFFYGSGIAVFSECLLDSAASTVYSFYHLGIGGAAAPLSGRSAPLYHDMLDFIDAQNGWRLTPDPSGGYDLQRTQDGGQVWTTLQRVIWEGDLDFLNAYDGYMLAHVGEALVLLVTHDGGVTWGEIRPIVEG